MAPGQTFYAMSRTLKPPLMVLSDDLTDPLPLGPPRSKCPPGSFRM
jgi:hypothetical protein